MKICVLGIVVALSATVLVGIFFSDNDEYIPLRWEDSSADFGLLYSSPTYALTGRPFAVIPEMPGAKPHMEFKVDPESDMSIPEFIKSIKEDRPEEYQRLKVRLDRLLDRYYLMQFVAMTFKGTVDPEIAKVVLKQLDAESYERNFIFYEYLSELRATMGQFIIPGPPKIPMFQDRTQGFIKA